MASGCSPLGRRAGRQLMGAWLRDQIKLGDIPGLGWLDEEAHIFKVPWKHLGRPDLKEDDYLLFQRYAVHTGKYREGGGTQPSDWKTNFRCAVSRLKDVREMRHLNHNGDEPYRAYQFVTTDETMIVTTSGTASVDHLKNNNDDHHAYQSDADEDLIFPQLTDCFDDLSFLDDIILKDSISQQIQHVSSMYGVSERELSFLKVKLYYGDREVCSAVVENPHGVRITYRSPPHLPADVVQENTGQLVDIFGPPEADEIHFPPSEDPATAKLLEDCLGCRALVFQCVDGIISATRLCMGRVFHSDSITSCEFKLPKEETVRLFDFFNDFYPKFKAFQEGTGPVPKYEHYFSIGSTWSETSPLLCKRLRLTLTHCFAEQLFVKWQDGTNNECCHSKPNEKDIAASQIEQYAKQNNLC